MLLSSKHGQMVTTENDNYNANIWESIFSYPIYSNQIGSKGLDSDSQSLLRGPLVVCEISSSGPRITILMNILYFAEQ